MDAFRSEDGVALEVEAGGAVYNNRILLDLITFCLGADVRFAILVPVKYETKDRSWQDPYPESVKLFDAIYANPECSDCPWRGS